MKINRWGYFQKQIGWSVTNFSLFDVLSVWYDFIAFGYYEFILN